MRPGTRQLLKKADLQAILVTDRTNILYLTGCEVSTGVLLARGSRYELYVDGRYTEAAAESAKNGVTVLPIDGLRAALKVLRRTGFEADDVSVATLARWKKTYRGLRFIPVSGIIEGFRRQKSPKEITLLRGAGRRTRMLLKGVPSMLHRGVSERELAWKLQEAAIASGGEGMSFDPIVAFGEHTSRPHHHPTSRRLAAGDIVQIDIGVRYRGYCGDLSDVFFTATKTTEQRNMYGALKEAKKMAIDSIGPGADVAAVDAAARTVLRAHDLEQWFPHALGHGVGLDVHEGVTISPRAKGQRFLRNEVVTVEPGAYIPGKFGMRLEDMIVVE